MEKYSPLEEEYALLKLGFLRADSARGVWENLCLGGGMAETSALNREQEI